MRETKDQTIARLETVISEQKKELTEVKKDRKRLNYTVERLVKEKERLSLRPPKEDTKMIKGLEKQIEELKVAVEEKERAAETLKNSQNSCWTEIKRLRRELKNKIVISENIAINKVVEELCNITNGHHFNREQLDRFNNGDRYFDYSFKDYPDTHIQNAIFSTKNLIIQIHPHNGRELVMLDRVYLEKAIGNRMEYLKAMNDLEQFKKSNPSNEELVEWTYQKGMELLPIYEDKIF